jgi:hypothetical protein
MDRSPNFERKSVKKRIKRQPSAKGIINKRARETISTFRSIISKNTNLAPGSCEPFAFAHFLSGAILAVFELLFKIAVIVRNFLHGIVAESTTEYFARLNAGSALCRTLRNH